MSNICILIPFPWGDLPVLELYYVEKVIVLMMWLLPGQMESHLYVTWMGSALWRTPTNTMMTVPRSWETWYSENLHPHYTFHGLYPFSWMTHRSCPQRLERCEQFLQYYSYATVKINTTYYSPCISGIYSLIVNYHGFMLFSNLTVLFVLVSDMVLIQKESEHVIVTNCTGWNCGVWWLLFVMVTGLPNRKWK